MKPLPGQVSLFDEPAQSAEEAQQSAAQRNDQRNDQGGTPAEYTARARAGLCGKCGAKRGKPHPDAQRTYLWYSALHLLCRPCWKKDLRALQEAGIGLGLEDATASIINQKETNP